MDATMPRKSRQWPDDNLPVDPDAEDPRAQYRFKERFGALIAATGVAAVPRALCHYLGELGLSYADLGFITHLLSYRWTSAYPFPKQRKLAQQAGLTRNGVQRRVYALQSLGYLDITERFDQESGRRTSNGYDLTPLLDRLNTLILRDWDTIWKHRDPLVSDGDDDDNVDNLVEKSAPHRVLSAPAGTQNSAGGRQQISAGVSRHSSLDPAHRNQSHEKESFDNKQVLKGRSKEDEIPAKEEENLRATTTKASISSNSQLVSVNHPRSATLDRIIADYSDQFGDRRHLSSNRSRARRLWAQTDLTDEEFAKVLYLAGARTAAHADQVRNVESDGVHWEPKLMPYFFGVVKGILQERGWQIDESRPPSRG